MQIWKHFLIIYQHTCPKGGHNQNYVGFCSTIITPHNYHTHTQHHKPYTVWWCNNFGPYPQKSISWHMSHIAAPIYTMRSSKIQQFRFKKPSHIHQTTAQTTQTPMPQPATHPTPPTPTPYWLQTVGHVQPMRFTEETNEISTITENQHAIPTIHWYPCTPNISDSIQPHQNSFCIFGGLLCYSDQMFCSLS